MVGFTTQLFTLGKGTPATQWIGGKVGTKASLAFWRRKIFLSLLGIKPNFSSSVAWLLCSRVSKHKLLAEFQDQKENVLAFWATKVCKVFEFVDTRRLLFSRGLVQNNR